MSCIDCHGPNLNDGEFGGPPLRGEAFAAKWFKMPAGASVGYAPAAMPPDGPGRLPMGTYVEIVAYIFSIERRAWRHHGDACRHGGAGRAALSATEEWPCTINLRLPPAMNTEGNRT